MEQEKQLQTTITDLNRRLERHEWRILDLEKRLAAAQPIEDKEVEVVQETDYREPILKRAMVTHAKSKNRNYKWVVVGIGFGIMLGVAYFMYS